MSSPTLFIGFVDDELFAGHYCTLRYAYNLVPIEGYPPDVGMSLSGGTDCVGRYLLLKILLQVVLASNHLTEAHEML